MPAAGTIVLSVDRFGALQLSWHSGKVDCKIAVRLRIDEAHYPDSVAAIFVVNAPWYFTSLFLGRVLAHPRTWG